MAKLGWWFCDNDDLRYGDRRKAAPGAAHEITETPVLCCRGLHASPRIMDALRHAPGPIVYRVKISGDIQVGDDKICGRRREYLWRVDCSEILPAFSRRCALDVVHMWDAPDVVLHFLRTGDGAAAKAAESWSERAAAKAAAAAAARAAAEERHNRRLTAMVSAARSKGDE